MTLTTYFTNLEATLEGVQSSNIFNYDETNFTDDKGVSKIVCRRGSGRVEKKVQHSKRSISVKFCGNASGRFVPPMVVYRAKNVYTELTTGGPVIIIIMKLNFSSVALFLETIIEKVPFNF